MIRVSYMLRRGPRGLGIDVDGQNQIIDVAVGGQAEADGLAMRGDVLEFVDGMALQGRP